MAARELYSVASSGGASRSGAATGGGGGAVRYGFAATNTAYAIVGDKCMCASVPVMNEITTGSALLIIGERKVARKGDKCAHGGEIIEGLDWLTFD